MSRHVPVPRPGFHLLCQCGYVFPTTSCARLGTRNLKMTYYAVLMTAMLCQDTLDRPAEGRGFTLLHCARGVMSAVSR